MLLISVTLLRQKDKLIKANDFLAYKEGTNQERTSMKI